MEDEDYDPSSDNLTKRMKHLNVVLNHFWKHWKSEYLLSLREVHRECSTNSSVAPINTGDIVILQEDKPRAMWRLAKVKELITGRDGKVRAAILTVPANDGQSTITLQRPVQVLYPLETSGQ